MSVIPISHPDISQAEIQAAIDALRSGKLSNGPRQARFEELVADRCDRRHAVAVSSGTAGLHLVLAAMEIGPGDEVITTPFSFIASANCILYVGATPVFVDIDPQSLNLDPAKVEAAITDKTRAILAVETFGNTRHIDRLAKIARNYELPLIEDACEALGGRHHGASVGSFGRAGVFGFYTNKPITTGEGGMIVTDDTHMAELCRSMRNQGRVQVEPENELVDPAIGAGWLSHERLGYNYRLSELACAIGIAQMERLDKILDARRLIAARYIQQMKAWEDLILPNIDSADEMSWFSFVVRLSDQYGQTERDRIIMGMRRHDIGAANYFPCIHLQLFYRERFGHKPGSLPIAESVSHRTIALPFYNALDETQVDLIVQTLKVMIQREQLLQR